MSVTRGRSHSVLGELKLYNVPMKLTAIISTALAIALIGGSASAEPIYQVRRIADGDTITVGSGNGKNIRVRFACIDTAEVAHTKQDRESPTPAETNQFRWGIAAQRRLTQLLKQSGNQVTLKITDTDRYGRKVAEVRLTNGTLVQQVLVREGLAMVYREYISSCPSASLVNQAEAQAKQRRAGVWSDTQFVPPWNWRRLYKNN
ncbi:MAG TPA: thermonuclease family protein [Candidatus Obscuribacterales bacterium]